MGSLSPKLFFIIYTAAEIVTDASVAVFPPRVAVSIVTAPLVYPLAPPPEESDDEYDEDPPSILTPRMVWEDRKKNLWEEYQLWKDNTL